MDSINLKMIAPHTMRPSIDEQYKPHQWIFIEDTQVVGFVEADCLVCAWREGHPKFPSAIMAAVSVIIEDAEPCTWWRHKDA